MKSRQAKLLKLMTKVAVSAAPNWPSLGRFLIISSNKHIQSQSISLLTALTKIEHICSSEPPKFEPRLKLKPNKVRKETCQLSCAYYLDNPEPAELKNMIECSAGEIILASIEKYWQSTDKYSSTLHSMMFFSIWESSSACFNCNRSINLGVSSHLLLLYRKTWSWKRNVVQRLCITLYCTLLCVSPPLI